MIQLRVLSTMGLAGVLQAFGPAFEAREGVRLETTLMPTVRLLERIKAGERGDVAILTEEGLDELIGSAVVEDRTDLARSFVGVAVKAGARHPDISSKDAFVATLLAANGVAMSQAGASGIFMAGLLQLLGIAEQMRPRATILPSGYTAELAASGAVEIAIQQVSELQVVPGVEIVGRLPTELGGTTIFSAGLFAGTPQADMARRLIAALASPDQASLYLRCGLEPAGRGGTSQA